MNDTSPEVEARYHKMLMARSAADRVKMAGSMFDAAKILVEAGIRAQNPSITPTELRAKIFERFYGCDFSADEREAILRHLCPPE